MSETWQALVCSRLRVLGAGGSGNGPGCVAIQGTMQSVQTSERGERRRPEVSHARLRVVGATLVCGRLGFIALYKEGGDCHG